MENDTKYTTNVPIDIYVEVQNVRDNETGVLYPESVVSLIENICCRVELETMKRWIPNYDGSYGRLYGPKSDKKGGK